VRSAYTYTRRHPAAVGRLALARIAPVVRAHDLRELARRAASAIPRLLPVGPRRRRPWASCDAGGIGVRTPWRLTITTFVRHLVALRRRRSERERGPVDICATATGAASPSHSATARRRRVRGLFIGRTVPASSLARHS
jgi:hypothetical protein